ncbi:MAG: hypothetical protein J7M29_04345 [Verrucomicrobia bacterium]|nr:hypothetical protein [Verrucomicrobiota bacterium]
MKRNVILPLAVGSLLAMLAGCQKASQNEQTPAGGVQTNAAIQKATNAAGATGKVAQAVAAKPKRYPFQAAIEAIDKEKGILTVKFKAGKTWQIQVGKEAKLTKGGQPATLDDAAAGEEIAGLVEELPDGTRRAVSLRFGPKAEESGAASTNAPAPPAPGGGQ